MKAPLSATEKVQRFLARVPDADAATIAKAKGLTEAEVQRALASLREAGVIYGNTSERDALAPLSPTFSLRDVMSEGFDTFRGAAVELAEKRPPARCTSALATLHEMEDLFKQLLGELGEEG